jgi:hypothetical protein
MDILAGVDLNLTRLLTNEMFAVILFWCVVGVVAVTAIIARQWRRVRVAEAVAALKAQMIDKGYSADEIEKALHAGLEPGKRDRRHRSARRQACGSSDFVIGGPGK